MRWNAFANGLLRFAAAWLLATLFATPFLPMWVLFMGYAGTLTLTCLGLGATAVWLLQSDPRPPVNADPRRDRELAPELDEVRAEIHRVLAVPLAERREHYRAHRWIQ